MGNEGVGGQGGESESVGGESGLVLPWSGQSCPPPCLVWLHNMVISDWSALSSNKFGLAPKDGLEAQWTEVSASAFTIIRKSK